MNPRLLIIEDDSEFADYLKRGLTYEGYQVQVANSAETGMSLLKASQPDLIILDVMLPGIDGMAACRVIRQTGYNAPILMLTAPNAIDDRVPGLDAGADDYLGNRSVLMNCWPDCGHCCVARDQSATLSHFPIWN